MLCAFKINVEKGFCLVPGVTDGVCGRESFCRVGCSCEIKICYISFKEFDYLREKVSK